MRTVFAYCHVGISYQILVTNIYITCVIKIHFFIMWPRPYFVYMYPYADPTADEADPTADDGTAPIRFDPIRSDPIRSDQAVPAANIAIEVIVVPMLSCPHAGRNMLEEVSQPRAESRRLH